MAGYIGPAPVPQATQNREAFTATSGQTSFATAGYTPQFIDVYLNGVKLAAADYTATNGSDVVLASGATVGDILEVVAFSAFTVADQAFTGTTTAANLTVTGAFTSQGIDDNANATAITIDSSENVGIGTSSPSRQLHLSGSTPIIRLTDTDTNAYGEISSSSSDGNLMFYADQGNTQANTTIRFYVDTTERMRIDSSGNVGIGTSSPSSVLTVNQGGATDYIRLEGPSSGDIAGGLQLYRGSTLRAAFYANPTHDLTILSEVGINFRANNANRMLITSAGNVGIGTSSPSETLDVSGNIRALGANSRVMFGPDGFEAGIKYATDASLQIAARSGETITFTNGNDGAERMRIDSSGNLLVGKTTQGLTNAGFEVAPSGQASATQSGASALRLNRLSSDGEILQFRKDGSTVGSIGTQNGSDFYIGSSPATIGLRFQTNEIVPVSAAGANKDAAIDVGKSNIRFKDLYLSGGVFLGGTGAANKLDDYEEGTWTPAVGGTTTDPTVTYTTQAGFYVKIGRMVHISMYLNCTAVSGGSGAVKISGVPFSANNAGSYFGGSQMEIFGLNVPSNMNNVVLRVNGNSGAFRLEFINTQASSTGGGGVGVGTGALANNFRVLGSFTYMTS